ncbi:glutamate formimidoyltransferase [bacterium]|nr:glutamate formimidoyltransferase [bacterium]MBU1985501.1 glutamate formimidoyltransferase [bacterium]
MGAIVECVPNISEGRDLAKIHRIADTVKTVRGVTLLDVDPNGDYNRSVITYAGEPEACVEATFRLTRAAYEEIDMTRHKGSHPRSGAVDVAPFVPVRGIRMAECAELARQLGKRVGQELQVPVYLYEAAASQPGRTNLARVRKGEYEALEEKLKDAQWAPDFGPAKFMPTFGCLITGARFFLVAYNVNLKTEDENVAQDIALHVREMGWPIKDRQGEEVLSATGKKVFHPGPLLNVKGMGVYLDRDKFCQISMNLTNYLVTGPHIAFEQAKHEAASRGVDVNGSEVVGLIPLQAVLLAAEYFVWRDRLARPASEREAVQLAHDKLEFSAYRPFDPHKKIIEYAIVN